MAISLITREINKLSTLSQKAWLAYYIQYHPPFLPLLALHFPLFGYSHFHKQSITLKIEQPYSSFTLFMMYIALLTISRWIFLVLFLDVVLKAAKLRDTPPSVCGLSQLYILYSSRMIPPSCFLPERK